MAPSERASRARCRCSPILAVRTLSSSVSFSIFSLFGVDGLKVIVRCLFSYPTDMDKQMLAKQTGLSRSQVITH